jgi:hypothetical protein
LGGGEMGWRVKTRMVVIVVRCVLVAWDKGLES